MTAYIVTIILVLIFSYLAQNSKNLALNSNSNSNFVINQPKGGMQQYYIFAGIVIFVLVFVAAFRYGVYQDWWGYAKSFGERSDYDNMIKSIKEFDEPGLYVICWVSKKIFGAKFMYMFIIASVITITCMCVQFVRYSDDICLTLLLYILTGCWHGSFNGVRQYLAAAVLMAGHRFIFEKKIIKYAIIVLLAACFHKSALIMIVAYFLVNKEFKWQYIFLFLAFTIVFANSYGLLFNTMNDIKGIDQNAENATYSNEGIEIFRLLINVVPLAFFPLVKKDFWKNEENCFYANWLMFNAAFIVAASGSRYLARIAVYTEMYLSMAYPSLLKNLENKSLKTLCTVILIGCYIYIYYHEITTRGVVPYDWAFGKGVL